MHENAHKAVDVAQGQNEMASNAQSEQQRMAMDNEHRSADRDAKVESEGARLKAMSKAKAEEAKKPNADT
jgi:hypothetical protein